MKYPTLHWYSTSNSSRSSNWQSIGGSITDFLLEPFTTTAHFYIAFIACSQQFLSSELITLILNSISWSLSIKFFEAQIPMLPELWRRSVRRRRAKKPCQPDSRKVRQHRSRRLKSQGRIYSGRRALSRGIVAPARTHLAKIRAPGKSNCLT